MLIYLDTNIYLDYLENRRDNLRPLGEFAFQLLSRALQCEFEILVSDIVLKELGKYCPREKINLILKPLNRKNKVLAVESKFDYKKEAAKLKKNYKIPFFDALHYILAIKNGAEFIVTNDKHFFDLPQSKIKIIKPNLL